MFKCPVDQKEIDPEREGYKCFIVEARTCRSVQVKDCTADDRPVLVHAIWCSFTQSAPTSFGNRWLLVTTQLRTAGEVLSIQSAASLDNSQRSAGL